MYHSRHYPRKCPGCAVVVTTATKYFALGSGSVPQPSIRPFIPPHMRQPYLHRSAALGGTSQHTWLFVWVGPQQQSLCLPHTPRFKAQKLSGLLQSSLSISLLIPPQGLQQGEVLVAVCPQVD